MKKYLRKEITNCSVYDLEGDRNQSIAHINYLFDEAENKGFKNCRIEVYCEDYDGSYLSLTGERLETDKEYEKRLKDEEKIVQFTKRKKEKEKEADLKLLAKLKKKYENE